MRKTVVLASVLKPVDDTRMYEKMAKTISQTNKYTVNIIGFYSKSDVKDANINCYPIFKFERLSISRLAASWKYYKKLLQLKPDIIIVNTFELLIVSSTYKILFGAKLLYDIREDHYENIRQLSTLKGPAKQLISTIVRGIETRFSRFVDHYILAERCYSLSLPFIGEKYTIIENKAVSRQQNPPYQRLSKPLNLLFSGTLAKSTGVLEAIELATRLHKEGLVNKLLIIGRCMESDTLIKIQQSTSNQSFIHTKGLDSLVPYHEIEASIAWADAGLIMYRPSSVTALKVPTKLYEYLNARLPVIATPNSLWERYYQHFDAAIIYDFQSIGSFKETLQNKHFYNDEPTLVLSWEFEQTKLIELLDNI